MILTHLVHVVPVKRHLVPELVVVALHQLVHAVFTELGVRAGVDQQGQVHRGGAQRRPLEVHEHNLGTDQ